MLMTEAISIRESIFPRRFEDIRSMGLIDFTALRGFVGGDVVLATENPAFPGFPGFRR